MLNNLKALFCITVILLLAILLSVYLLYNRRITGKNIFIIGGTSGLGLSLAKYLYSLGNNIVITSRKNENLDNVLKSFEKSQISTISGRVFDSLHDLINVEENFDYIFYCPGMAVPGYFKDQNDDIFEIQIKLNYLGMIRSLYHFKKCNRFPFKFIMACSTTALFTFPGYSSYAPSKACLRSFFESARYELKAENVNLKILYCCAMNTPGLKRENMTKPSFTKGVEYSSIIADPDKIAKYFVDNLNKRDSHSYDWFTYFIMIRNDCENGLDYLLFPFSVLIAFVAKMYMRRRFKIAKFNKLS
ncbi:uncharacterized protein VICG_00786 [Vittaforma corneae ATCC 50505]|uniref:Uncharacterized protein n=1 Tax=Vittaforma corneae (strain ATCC 50505) TaxID=993615 RepID=L2GMM7_VITCO|nr:uncharacterized protein VICG_00786 [Vittaforma corneae ATCC 50505]ELA42143.1 hypothetical protein VICG_00786 [Vittaforma corneae ATCC 50505]